ncbi:hypothetical protein ACN28S_67400 [Cystobacter fuscus]
MRRAKAGAVRGLPRRWGRKAAASALVVAGLVGVTWAASRGGGPGQEAPAAVAARGPAALAETDAGVSASTRGGAGRGPVAPARQETAAASVVQVAARALDNSKGQETAAMETKKRSAGKAAVVCTWAMLLAGETGCVGGPNLRKEPEPMACPAGSEEFMSKSLELSARANSSFPVAPGSDWRDDEGVTEVRDGQKLTFTSILADRPHTVYSGRWFSVATKGSQRRSYVSPTPRFPEGRRGRCACARSRR